MSVSCWRQPQLYSIRGDASIRSDLDGEQQQQRDQQREDAERFRHGEAENQVSELALRSRRIAQRTVEELAEDHADADTCAAHAETSNACADVLCCDWIHSETPSWDVGVSNG